MHACVNGAAQVRCAQRVGQRRVCHCEARDQQRGVLLSAAGAALCKLKHVVCVALQTGQPFAMKVLDKKRVAMSSHSKRDTMQDEIELLAQIDHPHIVLMEVSATILARF